MYYLSWLLSWSFHYSFLLQYFELFTFWSALPQPPPSPENISTLHATIWRQSFIDHKKTCSAVLNSNSLAIWSTASRTWSSKIEDGWTIVPWMMRRRICNQIALNAFVILSNRRGQTPRIESPCLSPVWPQWSSSAQCYWWWVWWCWWWWWWWRWWRWCWWWFQNKPTTQLLHRSPSPDRLSTPSPSHAHNPPGRKEHAYDCCVEKQNDEDEDSADCSGLHSLALVPL